MKPLQNNPCLLIAVLLLRVRLRIRCSMFLCVGCIRSAPRYYSRVPSTNLYLRHRLSTSELTSVLESAFCIDKAVSLLRAALQHQTRIRSSPLLLSYRGPRYLHLVNSFPHPALSCACACAIVLFLFFLFFFFFFLFLIITVVVICHLACLPPVRFGEKRPLTRAPVSTLFRLVAGPFSAHSLLCLPVLLQDNFQETAPYSSLPSWAPEPPILRRHGIRLDTAPDYTAARGEP